MTALSDTYSKARREIIALFGWNAESLTPDQTLRLDCAIALRLALDDLQGRVVRGETVDVAKMLTAADALSRLLPPAALAAPPEEANAPDPREIMWRTYKQMRDRGALHGEGYDGKVRRIAELEARIAELEAALAVSGGSTTAAITAVIPEGNNFRSNGSSSSATPAGNVVPLRTSERSEVSPSPPAAPPKPPPPKPAEPTIDLRAGYNNEPEPWRSYVGGRDPWADNR
jgi:hypothetical protein